jgi:hypothetical protein
MVVEGVEEIEYAPVLHGMCEQGKKTCGFAHFFMYKSPKTLFLLKSTKQGIFPRRFLRHRLIYNFL